MKHFHHVPPPSITDRQDLNTLARKAVLVAVRRLRGLGVDDPAAPVELAAAAMSEITEGMHAPHAHEGGPHAFGLLCAAIERLIDRSAGQTGKAN